MKNSFIQNAGKACLLFFLIFMVVALTLRFHWLGLGSLFIVSMLTLIPTYRRWGYWLFFSLMLFSNLSISILSPLLPDRFSMNILFGLDFFFAGLLLWWNFQQAHCRLPLSSPWTSVVFYLLLCLTLLFYSKGILFNGFSHATIYLRMLIYPFMLYLLGRYASTYLSAEKVKQWFITIGLLFGLLLLIEILAPLSYYSFLNVNHYVATKKELSALSVTDLLTKHTVRFFNSNWFKHFKVLRPLGAFMHPISTAYFFVLNLMLCLSYESLIMGGFFVIMIFLCGSKGAMASAVALIFFYFIKRKKPIKAYWVILTGLGYVICSYFIGLKSDNSHFYSLTASVLSLPGNLLGQGFGYGGSVTTGVKRTLDFVTINGDSGLAVLLNMTGIFTPFFYLGYMVVLYDLWKKDHLLTSTKVPYLIFFVFLLANSIFQEEGFSPYGMGLLMFLSGLEGGSPPQLNDKP